MKSVGVLIRHEQVHQPIYGEFYAERASYWRSSHPNSVPDCGAVYLKDVVGWLGSRIILILILPVIYGDFYAEMVL